MHDKGNSNPAGSNGSPPDNNGNNETPMNTNENETSDDVTFLHASVPIMSIIKPSESLNTGRNRLKEYFIDHFPLTFRNVTVLGKKADGAFIAHFKGDQEFANLFTKSHDLLKLEDAESAPIFKRHDPKAIKTDSNSRSIIATDIPLFMKPD